MPAHTLEKEEAKELSQEELEGVRRTIADASDQKDAKPKRKSLWREIFEGHEEFLGWTPD